MNLTSKENRLTANNQNNKMIDKLFNNVDLNKYVGLVFLATVVVLYAYVNPNTIKHSDTKKIEIKLASKPEFDEPNGDNVPSISFKADGYPNDFDISHCALHLINMQDILSLNKGDYLTVLVDKKYLSYKKKRLVYHPITICGIELKSKGQILKLEEYNTCEKKSWKIIAVPGFIFLIILFVDIRRIVRKKQEQKWLTFS